MMLNGKPECIAHLHAVQRAVMESVLGDMKECDAPGEDIYRELRLVRVVEAARPLVEYFDRLKG